MSKITDQWETPPDFWNYIDSRFSFTIDVACTAENAKCYEYITEEQDAMKTPWGLRSWCNCPYSNVEPWLRRAYDQVTNGPSEVACVLTHSAFATKWAEWAFSKASVIWLLNPRIQFLPPKGVKKSSNARDSIAWFFFKNWEDPKTILPVKWK